MKADVRAVVDTNVLISAALTRGSTPALVVRHLLAHGRLVFSEATFDELERRLWLPKFDRYVSLDLRRALIHDLSAVGDWITVGDTTQRWCRDPDDDKFVQLALAASADLIVTGDDDLLVLRSVRGSVIMRPAEAMAWLLSPPGTGGRER